ncbi:hypothetical protein GWI33_006063 [Rhynchophorus ferrugineus]|uniref:Uncharacterized protein n=1 Tax=Rhynchophorus ferrugineus TaxID=354439 RepID=A0A834MKZ8_RHYFE|nr:hypothetical protein GWI33_006063 [Rhynchophorus ferrugineus]
MPPANKYKQLNSSIKKTATKEMKLQNPVWSRAPTSHVGGTIAGKRNRERPPPSSPDQSIDFQFARINISFRELDERPTRSHPAKSHSLFIGTVGRCGGARGEDATPTSDDGRPRNRLEIGNWKRLTL